MSWNYANQTGDSAVYENRLALLMNGNKSQNRDIITSLEGGAKGIITSIEGGASDIWSGIKSAGGVVHDYAEAPLQFIEVLEYGAVAIGLLIAYGLYKSISQSDVTNIGTGVSKVISSAK